MFETQIITSVIGSLGLFITVFVLINGFKYQGQTKYAKAYSIARRGAVTDDACECYYE